MKISGFGLPPIAVI